MNTASTKLKTPLYARKVIISSTQTGMFTPSNSWANAGNGFALTIDTAGLYYLKVETQSQVYDSDADLYMAIGVNDTNLTDTLRRAFSAAANNVQPVSITSLPVILAVGDVVTFRAINPDLGGISRFPYATGSYEGYISAELLENIVPIIGLNRIQDEVNVTTTRALTVSAADITGWTITLPQTRRYKIKAQGSYILDDVDSGGSCIGTLELGLNGVLINGTQIYMELNGTADFRVAGPFSIEYEGDFSIGDIITLRGQKLTAAGDLIEIYADASKLARISYESVD